MVSLTKMHSVGTYWVVWKSSKDGLKIIALTKTHYVGT